MAGLENPIVFALQKASKIDRLWQPIVALEICNFLMPENHTLSADAASDLDAWLPDQWQQAQVVRCAARSSRERILR
jgi:hypothetical protein